MRSCYGFYKTQKNVNIWHPVMAGNWDAKPILPYFDSYIQEAEPYVLAQIDWRWSPFRGV